MSRLAVSLAIALALAGCTQEPPVAPAPPDTPRPHADTVPADGRMTEFFFYRAESAGIERRPSFVMRTPKVSITIAGEAVLEQAEAEIYGRDDEVTTVWAEQGRFDQETKMATMEGAVVLRRGSMTVEMHDLIWSEETRVAQTDRPVRLFDEDAELHADSMVFDPDDNALLLTNVVGGMDMTGRNEP